MKGKRIVFITGGARSGKSRFALNYASKFSGKRAYIATAQALDEEMKERIERHKIERGGEWETIEEPLRISEVIEGIGDGYGVIVLDCLTLWLSNVILSGLDLEKEISSFCHSLSTVRSPLFIVSNEVGMGIVPEKELTRRFRDLSGILNQKVAEIADEVYLVVSGIPLKIKG